MNLPRSISHLISSNVRPIVFNNIHKSLFHLDTTLYGYEKAVGPKKFVLHNNKIYPPQTPQEEARPAVISFIIKVKDQFRSLTIFWILVCVPCEKEL